MVEEQPVKTSNANNCPHCNYPNRAGVLVCENCDRRMVERQDTTVRLTRLQDLDQTTGAFAGFDDGASDDLLRLQIANAPIAVRIDPQKQTVLGRANPDKPRQPDIDLSAFKAHEHGVSSIHAMIDTQEGKIVIADLGSANGTFINGKRLKPHDMKALKNGDEIRMGNLLARIYFPEDQTSLF